MRLTLVPLLLSVLLSTINTATAASDSALPVWFPLKGVFSVNPDQITAETFGAATFKIARTGSDEYEEREFKGHHWATSLYPPGRPETWDKWNGEAAWQALKPQLERQGFKVVYFKQDPGNSVDATLAKEGGGGSTYLEVFVGNDPYSNSVAIVQTGPPCLRLRCSRRPQCPRPLDPRITSPI